MFEESRSLLTSDAMSAPEADAYPLAPSAATLEGPQAYLNADARDSVASNGKTSFTIDEAASQLVRAEPGWSAHLGEGYTVTYAYRSTEPAEMPDDTSGFSRFTATQMAQAELAMQAWSDVADITFKRVGTGTSGEAAYSNNASILFGNYSSGEEGASAFAYNPGDARTSSPSGDVWINSTLSYNQRPNGTNYGGQVLIHEIGHSIGLAHPSEYNADANTTFTYTADASYYEDSRQYTVMSYFGESNTGGNFQGQYASSPLLDDIAAAQLEYGPNMHTRTGDTVYGFNSTADRAWYAIGSSFSKPVFAVWDAGGADTLDFSGYGNNQLIDLREGFFSNVGGLVGNVAIAKGAQIEDAKGGAGSDTIHGNALGNTIWAGLGNDAVDGGTGGHNFLRGEDGNDTITGGADFDDINGNKGADAGYGGAGDDWVVGGQDNDKLYGEDGADVVLGNMGDDVCDGGAGGDVIRGGQGADVMLGGDGNDWMSGDRGNDTLTGGAGADVFHGFVGAGIDRVLDFHLSEGDRVQLDPGTPYSVVQSGADTVIMLGSAADEVILVGVQPGSLTGDWIFYL